MFDRMQAWSLLLPTAEERATALAALLQRGDGDHGSSGRRFMADLLVTCLMADGGLEAALEASLLAEAKDADIEDGHAGACDLPPPVGFSRGTSSFSIPC